MIEVISFRCPTCSSALQASSVDINTSMLCGFCGNTAKVPLMLEQAATTDANIPDAPVIFVKPTTRVYKKSRFKMVLPWVKLVCALGCVGFGGWLVWRACAQGMPTWGTTNQSDITAPNQLSSGPTIQTEPVGKTSMAIAIPPAPVPGLATPAVTPATSVSSTVRPNPQDQTPATITDPDLAAIDSLRKERERLLIKQERMRLEQEIANLKNTLPAKPPENPTGEELRAQIKRANGELLIAQRALDAANDEQATLKNLLNITTNNLNEDGLDTERRNHLQESRRQYRKRLTELERTIPGLDKNTKELAGKLKSLKDLAKNDPTFKPEGQVTKSTP